MKKCLCILLISMLMIPCAFAESIDLSGLSFDELVALKDRINLAIWQNEEWQEVTVPQGVWTVGEDIPAGTWTVKCSPEEHFDYAYISWGEKLSENGENISYTKRSSTGNKVCNPNNKYYKNGEVTEYSFTVQNGDYIVIQLAPVVFMPYVGKPNLGFK